MNDQEKFAKFAKLARKSRGLVGGLGGNFEESLDILAECENVEYEFYRLGDTIARAYWHDRDKGGELFGGCISVVSKDVDY